MDTLADPDVSPLAVYLRRVEAGALAPDAAQRGAVEHLDRLWHRLAAHGKTARSGLLGRLIGRRQAAGTDIRGLYLVGEVGRGKTMLMDLFYADAPIVPRERRHFHAFMQDMHAMLHATKRARPDLVDPIPPLADAVAARARLLCFDEFQVNDIADAMLLGRLFEALFARGVVMVATSNTRPEALFQDQPGGDAFKPFIGIIRRNTETVSLDGEVDYRGTFARTARTWITPVDATATAVLDAAFARLSGGAAAQATRIEVNGRWLSVPHAAGRVARFGFRQLCADNLGPGDYLALSRAYDAIVVDGVETLGADGFDVARRFITLIDTLYEAGTVLVASAAVAPERLFVAGRGARAFERTASRLQEMQSPDYLEHAAARRPPAEFAEAGTTRHIE